MSLEIEYRKVYAGCFEITLHGENGSYNINISDVYDPFEDWFYALERIYRFEIPSIIINPEGITYRIDILHSRSDEYCFRVVHHVENDEVFSCMTTIEEIVDQMYGKLMEFVKSDRYDPKEYETGSLNTGFPLKNYYNQTLELYLARKAFDDCTTYSKCTCCNQFIIVKSIDDMLIKAYEYIDKSPMLQKFLQKLNLDKTTIGISQNSTRKKQLLDPFSNFDFQYRDIQGTDSNIFLGFSEDFERPECIEIFPSLFREQYIRGWHKQFEHLSDSQKIKWLEELLMIIDHRFEGISNHLRYDCYEKGFSDKQVMLQENIQTERSSRFSQYPENTLEGPVAVFEADANIKNGKLKIIRIEFEHPSDSPNCPVSLWLHQDAIQMYPDYGDVIFWFGGKAGELESFGENYDFETNGIGQRVQEWLQMFYGRASGIFPDWDRFEQVGKELCKDVQEVVKDQYIITYYKSFEETYGNKEERISLGYDDA
jgi:hypothetical protein